MVSPTEIGQFISGLIASPFVGVLIGTVLTAYLIPKIIVMKLDELRIDLYQTPKIRS